MSKMEENGYNRNNGTVFPLHISKKSDRFIYINLIGRLVFLMEKVM